MYPILESELPKLRELFEPRGSYRNKKSPIITEGLSSFVRKRSKEGRSMNQIGRGPVSAMMRKALVFPPVS
jgi:hypothetical protein